MVDVDRAPGIDEEQRLRDLYGEPATYRIHEVEG